MSRYQRIHFKTHIRWEKKVNKSWIIIIELVDCRLVDVEKNIRCTRRMAGWLVVSFVCVQDQTKRVFIYILSSNQPTISKSFFVLFFFANCFGRWHLFWNILILWDFNVERCKEKKKLNHDEEIKVSHTFS